MFISDEDESKSEQQRYKCKATSTISRNISGGEQKQPLHSKKVPTVSASHPRHSVCLVSSLHGLEGEKEKELGFEHDRRERFHTAEGKPLARRDSNLSSSQDRNFPKSKSISAWSTFCSFVHGMIAVCVCVC